MSRLFQSYFSGTRGLGGGCSPPLFPNITLKQLHFRTFVVKFPGEACKMLYFYFKPPPPPYPTLNSTPLSLSICVVIKKNQETDLVITDELIVLLKYFT